MVARGLFLYFSKGRGRPANRRFYGHGAAAGGLANGGGMRTRKAQAVESMGQWLTENADRLLEMAAKEAGYIAARAPAGAIDPEDMAGDLVLDVLARAGKYDPRRGVPPLHFVRMVLGFRGRNRAADLARKAERARKWRQSVIDNPPAPAPPPETAEERLEGAALALAAAMLRRGRDGRKL